VGTKNEKGDPLFYRVDKNVSCEESMEHDGKTEKHILRFSVYAALFFAVLGLGWGLAIRSQMLIFDGIYSFVSVLMASLSVYVSEAMKTGHDKKFPFGRSQMEPMVIMLKALVILVVCGSALTKAAAIMISGGRETNALSAMVYCLVGIAGCLGSWLYIVNLREKARLSALVKAESMQWLFDALLSMMIFLGFLAAHRMQNTEHANYARYIDPLMVIVSAIFFSVVPVRLLIAGIKEMLQMSPGGDIYRVSRRVLEDISKKREFDGFVLRIVKSGRELLYSVGFVADDPERKYYIRELDDMREEVEKNLKTLTENPIVLDISFMHDKKWG
jgi:predicted Co/Zn/Cd cation transporter (cation efflux family)